jgi:hypothetical protein
MTEQEWMDCTDPQDMLEFLRDRAGERKLRLFAVACCRRIGHLRSDERCRGAAEAVEAAESFADGQTPGADLAAAREAARRVWGEHFGTLWVAEAGKATQMAGVANIRAQRPRLSPSYHSRRGMRITWHSRFLREGGVGEAAEAAAAQTLGLPPDSVADGDVDTFILEIPLLISHIGDQFFVDTTPDVGQIDRAHLRHSFSPYSESRKDLGISESAIARVAFSPLPGPR